MTSFDFKVGVKFVGSFALMGFLYALFFMRADPEASWWLLLISAAGVGLFTAFFGLLIFGVVGPIYAWYKHYRKVAGLSPLLTISLIVGGLGVALAFSLSIGWLYRNSTIAGWLIAACFFFTIVTFPYYWIKERRERDKLNVIDVERNSK